MNVWNVVAGIMAFFLIKELHSNTKAHHDIVKKFEALADKFENLINNEKEKRHTLEKDIDSRFTEVQLKINTLKHKYDQMDINILMILTRVFPDASDDIHKKIEEKKQRL